MAAYVITYDLSLPGRGYNDLYNRIKSYDTWAAFTESSWAIVTNQSPVQIRDYLSPAIDNNDKLFVGGPINQAAWIGLSQEISDWLKKNL